MGEKSPKEASFTSNSPVTQ